MKNLVLKLFFILTVTMFLMCSASCVSKKKHDNQPDKDECIHVGWASADITPDKPVLIAGQFPAKVSEGIMDPITITALAIEKAEENSHQKAILISCDLAIISDITRKGNVLIDNIKMLVSKALPEIDTDDIIINATHTHTAPVISELSAKEIFGLDLDVMCPDSEFITPTDYMAFITKKIVHTAEKAWEERNPGGISYGLSHAVVNHNRLQVSMKGKSKMYGTTDRPEFSHLEGYEDHEVNLLYTWNSKSKLTGVIINIAAPSQVSEGEYSISADYWHDIRLELHKRLGKSIYILPQCSAAGDQSPHIMVDLKAEERMQKLIGNGKICTGRGSQGRRKQIALSIADAVTSILPYMKNNIKWSPCFEHRMDTVNLSRRLISIDDVNDALQEAEGWRKKYEQMLNEIKNNTAIQQKERWYSGVTSYYRYMMRGKSVKERYELEKDQPKMPVEIHVLRLGDIVMATNPFELYLDYGIRIKARSPAIQTFLIQLAGIGSYVPTKRSILGGAYGAVPASTMIGPEGGQELVEKSLEMINSMWND
ncbi:hypothetical protein [Mariniphaga sediminis]|uniref:hypothetical protein n=1 Tax=Mariniphaga sediminis TaxID=1628158 RepID=UPI0035645D64